jgi:hypothetical protein
VITWATGSGGGAASTMTDASTSAAGSYVSSPGWEAVTVHAPGAISARIAPSIVHTSGVGTA